MAQTKVTKPGITDDAVTTAKILDNNVTVAKLPTTLDISGNTVTLPASVSGLGTGITNAQLAGSITDAKITGLSSSKLTGALPAISGASLTALNATNIGSGTVPTARLGSGSASSSVFLAGDNTWVAAGGGKILQLVSATDSTNRTTTSTSFVDASNTLAIVITPSATSSTILVFGRWSGGIGAATSTMYATIQRDIDGGAADTELGTSYGMMSQENSSGYMTSNPMSVSIVDSPSTTSECTYRFKIKVQTNTGHMMSSNSRGHSYAMEIDGS